MGDMTQYSHDQVREMLAHGARPTPLDRLAGLTRSPELQTTLGVLLLPFLVVGFALLTLAVGCFLASPFVLAGSLWHGDVVWAAISGSYMVVCAFLFVMVSEG